MRWRGAGRRRGGFRRLLPLWVRLVVHHDGPRASSEARARKRSVEIRSRGVAQGNAEGAARRLRPRAPAVQDAAVDCAARWLSTPSSARSSNIGSKGLLTIRYVLYMLVSYVGHLFPDLPP